MQEKSKTITLQENKRAIHLMILSEQKKISQNLSCMKFAKSYLNNHNVQTKVPREILFSREFVDYRL